MFGKVYGLKVGHITAVCESVIRPYKITVPGIYQGVGESMMPWARVGNFGGGSYDSGGQPVYVKGATVGIIFEHGDRFKPIILCGIQKITSENQEYSQTSFPEEGSYKPTEDRPTEMTTDGPIEAIEPGVYTLYKSPKGMSIIVSERPEEEYLKIIDRAGQVIEMSSPVTIEANENNKAQRGTADASKDTALPYSDIKDEAYIRVTDLSGNQIELYSKADNERIMIQNNKHGNTYELNKDGMFFQVLNGKDGGGLSIEATADGLKVNGQYLATEALVDWLKTHKGQLCMSTSPGNASPMFPDTLTEFVTKESVSINAEGLRSKL